MVCKVLAIYHCWWCSSAGKSVHRVLVNCHHLLLAQNPCDCSKTTRGSWPSFPMFPFHNPIKLISAIHTPFTVVLTTADTMCPLGACLFTYPCSLLPVLFHLFVVVQSPLLSLSACLCEQMLYYNLTERPKQMFDKVVEVKVLNAKVLLSDCLIGSFKFDLGMVYDELGELVAWCKGCKV